MSSSISTSMHLTSPIPPRGEPSHRSSSVRGASRVAISAVRSRRPLSETEKLAIDNARMEERLNALRAQLDNQRQKYHSLRQISSASSTTSSLFPNNRKSQSNDESSSIWNRGGKGSLSSHAKVVLEAKRKYLKLRSLDAVDYIGTIPFPSSQSKPTDDIIMSQTYISSDIPSQTNPYHQTQKRAPSVLLQPINKSTNLPPSQISASNQPQLIASKQVSEYIHENTAVTNQGIDTCSSSTPNTLIPPSTWTIPVQVSNMDLTQNPVHDSGFIDGLVVDSRPGSPSTRFMLTDGPKCPPRLTSLQSVYQFDTNMEDFNEIMDREKNHDHHQTSVVTSNTNKHDWWDGVYNEQINRNQFQQAVAEWRMAGTSGNNSISTLERPCTTATCSVETTHELFVEQDDNLRWHNRVQFSPGMSLMERMLLRKLRDDL